MSEAYFAGGCFWCITPVFSELPGVLRVTSGYSGGDEENPSYEDVKRQLTHHRETIRITYDPARVSYRKLIGLFLAHVDPFDGEGQYIDRGASYTLAVYYTCETEREAALTEIGLLEKASGRKPAVSVEPFRRFWEAEEYHQDYYRKNPLLFEEEMIASGRKKV